MAETPINEDWKQHRPVLRGLVQAVFLGALMFSSLGMYLVVLKWRGHDGVRTDIPWDHAVPFWPNWVWVYFLPYLCGPVLIGLLSWKTCMWFLPRALAVVGISLAIFIIYPTQTIQVPCDVGEGWTAEVFRVMVEVDDPPANAAPSLHVSLTCLLAIALMRDFPRWWPACLGGALLVWVATLFTRQHCIIDVVTGALLGGLAAVPWRRRKVDVGNGGIRNYQLKNEN